MENIRSRLSSIERDRGTEILSARDIGSHAWGLNGPESDRDIGIIFLEDYNPNTISQQSDSISLGDFETYKIEFKAWSLRRFAELLHGSNPTALEYASSSLNYIEEPEAFDSMCDYALETFNPADAIGASIGKATSNYWKYLRPTLIQKSGEKERGFATQEYIPRSPEGMLKLESLDGSGETERIHASRLGDSSWRIIHRENKRHEWKITTEYDDPNELESMEIISARHSDTGEEITLSTDKISEDSEFRWGTSDRTIKRYLYICRGLISADIIANTQEYPPAKFDRLIEGYTALSEAEAYTNLPIDTLREYANKKRSGDGNEYTPIPHQSRIEKAIEDIKTAFEDPDNHRGGPDAGELNSLIREIA